MRPTQHIPCQDEQISPICDPVHCNLGEHLNIGECIIRQYRRCRKPIIYQSQDPEDFVPTICSIFISSGLQNLDEDVLGFVVST